MDVLRAILARAACSTLATLRRSTPHTPFRTLTPSAQAQWKFRTYWAPHGFSDLSAAQVQQLRGAGQAALDAMEAHLGREKGREWFVGARYGIADIALFAYTQHAEILGFTVGQAVKSWLSRVQCTDRWVRIGKDPTGKNPF